MALLGLLASASPALAAEKTADDRSTGGQSGGEPDGGVRPPDVHETGRVGDMRPNAGALPRPQALAPVGDVAPPRMGGDSREIPVRVHAPGADLPRAGAMDRDLLDQEVRPYLAGLRGCRLEVARRRQVAPNAVTAGTVKLRWTILPSGRTDNAKAIAPPDTDEDVMHCLSQRMWGWHFDPAPAAPVDVSYDVTLQ